MNAPAAALQPASDEERLAQALHTCARPLVVLATGLRKAVPPSPAAVGPALVAAVERFERELAAAGWDARGIAAASYLLCTWLDEVVADTPWSSGGFGALLERFHGESDGSRRVMQLLSRLAERPRENRALLELFHACIGLGLGSTLRADPDAAAKMERLRTRVFAALPQGAVELAPPWRCAVAPAASQGRHRLGVAALIGLALVALAVYSTSQLLLAARVDDVFAAMHALSAATGAPVPAPPAAGIARLAPLLAMDIAAGRLGVRDEAHRSTVTLPASALFDGASAQPSEAAPELLARIATVLAGRSGKVLVVGHTDGSDPRSARMPSAWHQSYDWAREVADALARKVPAERLTVEGAADLASADDAALPRRRVDIVYYP